MKRLFQFKKAMTEAEIHQHFIVPAKIQEKFLLKTSDIHHSCAFCGISLTDRSVGSNPVAKELKELSTIGSDPSEDDKPEGEEEEEDYIPQEVQRVTKEKDDSKAKILEVMERCCRKLSQIKCGEKNEATLSALRVLIREMMCDFKSPLCHIFIEVFKAESLVFDKLRSGLSLYDYSRLVDSLYKFIDRVIELARKHCATHKDVSAVEKLLVNRVIQLHSKMIFGLNDKLDCYAYERIVSNLGVLCDKMCNVLSVNSQATSVPVIDQPFEDPLDEYVPQSIHPSGEDETLTVTTLAALANLSSLYIKLYTTQTSDKSFVMPKPLYHKQLMESVCLVEVVNGLIFLIPLKLVDDDSFSLTKIPVTDDPALTPVGFKYSDYFHVLASREDLLSFQRLLDKGIVEHSDPKYGSIDRESIAKAPLRCLEKSLNVVRRKIREKYIDRLTKAVQDEFEGSSSETSSGKRSSDGNENVTKKSKNM